MRKLILMALAVCLVTACEKPMVSDDEVVKDGDGLVLPDQGNTKKFTFTLKGDFSDEWKSVTRGYLQADGKDLTDVWVLDYDANGTLLQQLHQDDNTADDFGQPVLQLAYGSHHVYFIASRGQSPTLDTENHLIKFAKVLDTFYKDYTVDVVSTSNGNRAVTLDRIVTKLKLIFSDAIPADAATFNVTPSTWYYGWDYVTGAPSDARSSQVMTLNIPSSSIGVINESVNMFGFSGTTEWTTDVTLNAKTAGNDVLGTAVLSAVPFKANRVSEFTGPLFSSNGAMTLSLNTTWNDSYQGTW